MSTRNLRRFKRKSGISFYLDEAEVALLEKKTEIEKRSISEFVANLVRNALQSNERSQMKELSDVLMQIAERLSKLERIQRTLILNTAYARGYVIGSARTAPAESRKSIEQEMVKTYEKQREFFFEVYPEQREGETSEARP